jgi:hypothetical protein
MQLGVDGGEERVWVSCTWSEQELVPVVEIHWTPEPGLKETRL